MHQSTPGDPVPHFHAEWRELPQPLRTILKAAEWKASASILGQQAKGEVASKHRLERLCPAREPSGRVNRDSRYLQH